MAPTLEDMHMALGRFLTECGRVEFTMLLFVDIISDAPIERLFDEYSPKTFGRKIKWFREWCELSGVPDDKKELLENVYQQLDELLPKRNYLVHGETWEGTFNGQPNQPYRVGVIKDNLDYLDKFDRGEHGENVFSLEQVREVVALCEDIRSNLDVLREADSSEE
jgi:hypothetical protein